MSHDENEQQHIKSGANERKNEACFGFAECSPDCRFRKQTRQSIHLQSQPHKKGSPLGGGDNRGNTRIGVVGVSPTDIPRCGLGCQPNLRTDDNLLATHFIKLN